jgi:glycerol-3-phosphate dehydrogenase (NAD(P)+)
MSAPRVAIVGGGFGRALAQRAAAVNGQSAWWTRRASALSPDVLPRGVIATSDLREVARAELVVLAVPSEYVLSLVSELGHVLDGAHFVIHVSRGFVGTDLKTVSQVVGVHTAVRRVGVLAGPLTEEVLVKQNPGGAIVGTEYPEVVDAVRDCFAGPTLRVYETADIIGVEVGAAMTGLLSFALGFSQGLGFGSATLGVLVSRGVAEMARLGEALGADAATFTGLAAVGDLVAAAAGDDRPELRLGRLVAKGRTIHEAIAEVGAHVESTTIGSRVAAYAERRGFSLPITEAVAHLLEGRVSVAEAVQQLMSRRAGKE